ncbi:AI-2E family transporter [Zongyangia hominis]|uniref:AI-2E family transporter n=1 Tax=Zongyangia hominis TaxID=2763677 RepID=A0A926ICD8_9FIRM|nr:AI-2E family transporter [Zongyangia hominis]MBC8571248.1 AI-2E family transporter [Zongyangia hominis]
MLENTEKRHQLAKWLISIITICILIYLGIRHINQLAVAVTWLKELMNPLLIGFVLALFLNVPLGFIERHLFQKKPTPRKKKMRRPLAILLSFALVIGIFIGIAFLVIPELVDAVGIVISSIMNGMDQLAAFESTADYSKLPFGEQLSQIDIDFVEIKTKLEEWIKQLGTTVVDGAASALGGITSTIFDFIIGLVFSIYILANKEKLKRQISRLIRVWLPKKFGEWSIHVASVCGRNFKLFVAGQTTEAIILGTLCAIGMLILRIPYAPMIGALVGVTALIPYVGAWIATLIGAFMILTVNPFKALVFVIFLLTLQQIEGNAIYPKVVGAKINLPAMWVLAAITVGGNLGGPIGMLLGVPAAASAYALLKEATDKREAVQKQASTTEK